MMEWIVIQLNFAISGGLKYHMLSTLSHKSHVMSSHRMESGSGTCAIWPIIFGRRKHLGKSRAKYFSSVQNIDSHQLVEWGDKGSFEGTMTQLKGNPKNPPQFIILLGLARWLLASRGVRGIAINCMEHRVSITDFCFLKEAQLAVRGG